MKVGSYSPINPSGDGISLLQLPTDVENSTEWIAHLKMDPKIAHLYSLCAGVSEGYTVEEHTRMVLEQLDKYFSHPEHLQILEKMGLTKHQFGLFLALHDIGKGQAVLESPAPSFVRKEKELAYCCEVINRVVQDPEVKAIFVCLLEDDNIGDLLKQPYVTKGVAISCAQQFIDWSAKLGRSPLDLAKLKILFHMIDASSYPSLKGSIFKRDQQSRNKLIYQSSGMKRTELIYQILEEETLDGDVILPPGYKTITENMLIDAGYRIFSRYVNLENAKAQAKTEYGATRKNCPVYREFCKKLKILREHHMLPRIAAAIKACARDSNGFDGDLKAISSLKKKFQINKDKLKEHCRLIRTGEVISLSPDIEKKLHLLEDIKFLHGTHSGTLAMMALTERFEMGCTGELIQQGIAPMAGEISEGGCGVTGVNQVSISAETVRAMERVKSYTKNFGFDIDRITQPLLNPFTSMLDSYGIEDKTDNLIRLAQQELELFQDLFPPETCNRLVESLTKIIKKNEQNFLYEARVPHQKTMLALFKSHGQSAAHMKTKSKEPVSKDFINECRFPLVSKFSADNLTPMHVRLLQIRQWDEELFQKIVHETNIVETVRLAREKVLGPPDLIVKIFKREFTPEERKFISSDGKGVCSASLADIGEKKIRDLMWPEERRRGGCNYDYESVERELKYYLNGNYIWFHLLKKVLMDRVVEELNRSDQLKIMECVEKRTRKLHERFDKLEEFLASPSAKIKIPKEGLLREAMERSFPIIFASTCYKPQARMDRSEFEIPEKIHVGEGGINVLITNTEEHRRQIYEILPERLHEDIRVYLESELDIGDFPLMHSQLHVKC